MKLNFRAKYLAMTALLMVASVCFAWKFFAQSSQAYAEDGTPIQTTSDEYFVTIHDQDTTLTVKTGQATVAEVLERSEIQLVETDIVEPSLDTVIDGDYNINIYRARPAIILDGVEKHYVMTASYDPAQIASEAGLTIYDGDEFVTEFNGNFLQAGAASTYRLIRNGGRSLTAEESIPYATEQKLDYNLAKGEKYLERAGEEGRKSLVYRIEFQNNVEVKRELISEEVTKQPVTEIVVVGAKASISPERAQCAEWARQAGVSEGDLSAALDLIYHESGCRVDAKNPSGAYGIPQSLPGSKMSAFGADWETNPVTQIKWMANYVTTRYGGWNQAMAYWWTHHWY